MVWSFSILRIVNNIYISLLLFYTKANAYIEFPRIDISWNLAWIFFHPWKWRRPFCHLVVRPIKKKLFLRLPLAAPGIHWVYYELTHYLWERERGRERVKVEEQYLLFNQISNIYPCKRCPPFHRKKEREKQLRKNNLHI